jgi:hypothetical protein
LINHVHFDRHTWSKIFEPLNFSFDCLELTSRTAPFIVNFQSQFAQE